MAVIILEHVHQSQRPPPSIPKAGAPHFPIPSLQVPTNPGCMAVDVHACHIDGHTAVAFVRLLPLCRTFSRSCAVVCQFFPNFLLPNTALYKYTTFY